MLSVRNCFEANKYCNFLLEYRIKESDKNNLLYPNEGSVFARLSAHKFFWSEGGN